MKKLVSAALVAVSLLAQSAFAALPTEATDAISLVGTDGGALQAAIWVPLGAVTVGFVIMKLFKRGANKI